jgi:hypothetical protein
MTNQEYQKKVNDMNLYLQSKMTDEPNDMLNRMQNLETMMAQAGQYYSECKMHYDNIVKETILASMDKEEYKDISASTLNMFIKAASGEWNFLVNSFDRINAAAVHQHDGLRTRISYVKTLINA